MLISVNCHDNSGKPEPITVERITHHSPELTQPDKLYYRLLIGSNFALFIEPERARGLRDLLTAQLEQEPDQAVCTHGKPAGIFCDECEEGNANAAA